MEDNNDYKTLIIEGGLYKTHLTTKFKNRKIWEAPNLNHIYSFIPGTVLDIYVKTGEKVKAGQTLLMLDAMKMHNQIRMPFDGEIVRINVKKNQVIPKNQILIEIKPKTI
jgi:biotin carboxyl carrier protein